MVKRTLEEVFNNDPLGLLEVSVTKTKKLSNYAIYYDTFEELKAFIEQFGREPDIEAQSIHEAKLAARLSKLRSTPEALEALAPFDTDGLLGSTNNFQKKSVLTMEEVFCSDLLVDDDDIFNLKHVHVGTKSQTASQDLAIRKKCLDFDRFKPLFKQIQTQLDDGTLATSGINGIAEIQQGQAFILSGLIAYVAEIGEKHERRKGHHNARMRVVYSNGMESNLLLRSFGAALYKDKASREIVPKEVGKEDSTQHKSGVVYVLKSKSQNPDIARHKEYLHKIGVTTSDVKKRVANAAKDATYLLDEVEVVAEFTLYNMNLKATEKLLHTILRDAKADIKIPDRFGNLVSPKEWFFVPLDVIRKAILLIESNDIKNYRYNAVKSRLEKISHNAD
ncbi:GIY-YIG nuclease family protein [Vibrio parahaemolyticus]|uniref:GIY-YIG nuclease family protein n=1 Tax=Vibrio parahaemolyticus TaxID=670 RepID=UPI00235F0BD3|nr:GIY-YIG nuclease family protein [Vibrio parahaemolyticus]